MIDQTIRLLEKPHFSFVGEKCCNTTILDPKTVGVSLTFQSFVGATFNEISTTKERKLLQHQQILLLGRLKLLDPTVFFQQKQIMRCCGVCESFLYLEHTSLKFTKWGPKKSEDGANGDRVLFKYCMHGKARPYAIVSNNISGTHGNLKGSKLVNLSDKSSIYIS